MGGFFGPAVKMHYVFEKSLKVVLTNLATPSHSVAAPFETDYYGETLLIFLAGYLLTQVQEHLYYGIHPLI